MINVKQSKDKLLRIASISHFSVTTHLDNHRVSSYEDCHSFELIYNCAFITHHKCFCINLGDYQVSPDVDGLSESAFLKQDELTDLVTLTYAGATDCYLIQG